MVRERISDGDIVRHFKREFVDTAKFDDAMYLYVVLSMNAMDTTNGGRVVVYKALYGDNKIFVRPRRGPYGRSGQREVSECQTEVSL